jgi:thiamine-monophosphate kinase
MDEFEFIKIVSGYAKDLPNVIQGIGDDAAVIKGRGGRTFIISTDISASNVHFRLEWASPREIGRKVLVSNISDIAAMGATPLYYLISIAVPSSIQRGTILGIVKGMQEEADRYKVGLIGGDTSSSKGGLFISITIIGEAAEGEIVYRSGAKCGDAIYVSGALGGSAAGLRCLKKWGRQKGWTRHLIERHLLPTPRVALGRLLARKRLASAMIDISDGLLKDIEHITICHGLGYKIDGASVPIFKGVERCAAEFKESPLSIALTSGEEYELLFTVRKDDEARLLREIRRGGIRTPITKIGMVKDNPTREIFVNGKTFKVSKYKGYSHRIGKN